MNSKTIFAFVLGAAVGVGASCQYFKKKYETLAFEAIESVKETFSYKKEAVAYDFSDQDAEDEDSITDISQNPKRMTEEEYFDYSAISKKKEATKPVEMDDIVPYVIPPENFGEYDTYQRISLTYY